MEDQQVFYHGFDIQMKLTFQGLMVLLNKTACTRVSMATHGWDIHVTEKMRASGRKGTIGYEQAAAQNRSRLI